MEIRGKTSTKREPLLDSMHRAGIIEYIEERPRKVKLLKKIDITVEDISD